MIPPTMKATHESIFQTQIERHQGDTAMVTEDCLAVEEPLEIRLEFGPLETRTRRSLSITMRTPGHDFELASGFLLTEGLISSAAQIQKISYCGPALFKDGSNNTVRVELAPEVEFDFKKLERHFYTTSSCGVCGKTSLEALRTRSAFGKSDSGLRVRTEIIHALPDTLRSSQGVFSRTGGLHAAALFSADGRLLILREDVGRHNAFDKVVGRALLDGLLPLSQTLVVVSGRASFELLQKATMSGIPFFAAVGAPSSLAVELAREAGITLLGFVRDNRFNIYNGANRVVRSEEFEKELTI